MKGVLQRDPAAKILLTAGSEVHLSCWGRTLGSDLVERLVFLPHLDHAEMLLVVAHCKVMLDTFPWGGGVTLLEALLAGVPVVTLPARISVLPLAGCWPGGRVGRRRGASGVRCRRHGEQGRQAGHELNAYRQSLRCDPRTEKPVIRPHRATREWEQFLERAVRSAISPDAKIKFVLPDEGMDVLRLLYPGARSMVTANPRGPCMVFHGVQVPVGGRI